MKQDLWLANSSLLLTLATALGLYGLLLQEPPTWRPLKIGTIPELEKKKEAAPASAETWAKIYQSDMFGTYVAPEVKPTKQSLITPIPEPKPPVIPPLPEVKKQEFITPLNIGLRGIICGADELRNVAMIADETGKEGMYHLGEKVKDAQIIKIAHNRVVFLRANGQQEVFYLRKDDLLDEQLLAEKWKYIIRKVNDQTVDVDPTEFVKEVDTLGNLVDRLSIVGTAFDGKNAVGVLVGKIVPNDVASYLGLADNDVIKTINDLNMGDSDNRIKAYDDIVKMSVGGSFKVGINRGGKDVLFTYNLAKIGRPRKSIFPGIKPGQPQPSPEEAMKMNRLQQREQTIRDFNKSNYEPSRHEQTMLEIRRRILEGIQQRLQNNRER